MFTSTKPPFHNALMPLIVHDPLPTPTSSNKTPYEGSIELIFHRSRRLRTCLRGRSHFLVWPRPGTLLAAQDRALQPDIWRWVPRRSPNRCRESREQPAPEERQPDSIPMTHPRCGWQPASETRKHEPQYVVAGSPLQPRRGPLGYRAACLLKTSTAVRTRPATTAAGSPE